MAISVYSCSEQEATCRAVNTNTHAYAGQDSAMTVDSEGESGSPQEETEATEVIEVDNSEEEGISYMDVDEEEDLESNLSSLSSVVIESSSKDNSASENSLNDEKGGTTEIVEDDQMIQRPTEIEEQQLLNTKEEVGQTAVPQQKNVTSHGDMSNHSAKERGKSVKKLLETMDDDTIEELEDFYLEFPELMSSYRLISKIGEGRIPDLLRGVQFSKAQH